MFYVYEWYIKDTNEIFYVGKGTKNRYKVTYDRNSLFTKTIQEYDCESRIIKYFQNEKDAFEYEAKRINELKALGQCKCNIHSGGAGGSSEYWTDKLRKEYSINNPMKDPKQRERMSKYNPMKNPEIAKKVGLTKARRVIIGDIEYPSVKAAQEKYNTCYDTIANWCKKGINPKGEKCRFSDQQQIEFKDKRYNKGGSKQVIYKGVTYQSQSDFYKAAGISGTTGLAWLKRGFDPKGNPCRRVGDTRELTFESRYTIRGKKPVIVNGVRYESCKEACEKLNIKKTTLHGYLNGLIHNPKYICTYDNQQPS